MADARKERERVNSHLRRKHLRKLIREKRHDEARAFAARREVLHLRYLERERRLEREREARR